VKISHPPAGAPIAVIDVGSNSARVVVLEVGPGGHLVVLADGRAPLRLARDLGGGHRLSKEAIDRTVEVLRDFRAIATGAGADRAIAVATAAMRESENAGDLIERVRVESDLDLKVIDGRAEARLGFLGAVHGLQVDHGVTMDIGGGSVELSRFRDRRPTGSWTLPLGSLALSDAFLKSDPPCREEVEALRRHIADGIARTDLGRLQPDERLIGTGGTVRTLAKIDRHTRSYPISRLHGYVLTRRRVQDLVELLAGRRLARRRRIAGLNEDRSDSIVGGALVALGVVEAVGADDVLVSGQGLREGLVYDAIHHDPPPVEAVRQASIEALVSRFAVWDRERARRRALIADRLQGVVEPGAGPKGQDRLAHAATVLDIGRGIDYYRRYEHTADIVIQSDLAGFSHRKLALLSAVVRLAGDERARIQAYRPLLDSNDRAPVARQGALLELADEIEHRLPPGQDGLVACRDQGRTVVLEAPVFDPWRQQSLARRFATVFRKRLILRANRGSDA
jgi:exopolyphosphatase/guanosine-5'-triphosphate,3'-diphosphate pyrophosphatase